MLGQSFRDFVFHLPAQQTGRPLRGAGGQVAKQSNILGSSADTQAHHSSLLHPPIRTADALPQDGPNFRTKNRIVCTHLA